MKAEIKAAAGSGPNKSEGVLSKIFAGLFGALLGLTLLKFGNPITMEKLILWPENGWEWVLNPWPVVVGYWLLAAVAVVGLLVTRWKTSVPAWLLAMPLAWLGWQVISATQTESASLSTPTVIHFGTCVVSFELGLFALSAAKDLKWFWAGLLAGFVLVLAAGIQQHFGGLEESHKYWFLYVYPTLKEVPPDFLKKMSSNRIFSTLFYPNTLAGVILLLLPVTLALLNSLREQFTAGARRFLMAVVAVAALGCLVWSGSKGGWLLMLIVGVVAAMFLPLQRQLKVWLVVAVLALGLAGFTVKYLGYFKKGATSVGARFDYWRAALETVKDKPVFGTGPGTFGKAYEQRKRPEAEMAKLTHNDYLEQASDSGLVGFAAFSVWVVGSLVYIWRRGGLKGDWIKLAVWLGLLGWAMQSLMEFGLYIPAIAWVAFALLGWLLGQTRNQLDTAHTPR